MKMSSTATSLSLVSARRSVSCRLVNRTRVECEPWVIGVTCSTRDEANHRAIRCQAIPCRQLGTKEPWLQKDVAKEFSSGERDGRGALHVANLRTIMTRKD